MKDEIKQILDLDIDRDDKIVFIDYTDNLGNKHEYEDINAEQLLDYITNLQEENERLNENIRKKLLTCSSYEKDDVEDLLFKQLDILKEDK